MPNRLYFAAGIEADVGSAFAWYENESKGLGEQFLHCVGKCIERICFTPEAFEKVSVDYRRAIVSTFPYIVFYEFDDEQIKIVGIFHASQDPKKWKKRLEQL